MTAWTTVLVRVGRVAAVLAAVWFYLRWFEWRNIFHPVSALSMTPKDMGLEFEEVTFVSEDDVRLSGWWIPHDKARGTIIHCHGNAGNISDRVWMAADMHRLGVNVFLFDYRGYGASKGIPTEKGTYRDARAAYEVVRARYEDAEAPPVIVHGQSLGGAVATQLAVDKPVKGLIVESSFTSTMDMARRLYPWLPVSMLCQFRYNSAAKVGNVHAPALYAHSREDDLVPFDMGRQLYELAAEPKEFVELRGGHNDAGWATSPEYWHAIESFVTRVFGPAP